MLTMLPYGNIQNMGAWDIAYAQILFLFLKLYFFRWLLKCLFKSKKWKGKESDGT